MFNDPWVLPDEVCVIVFTFFHEGEYDPYFLTLIMFNDPWVLPDEVCVIVFTFFHEGEYDP